MGHEAGDTVILVTSDLHFGHINILTYEPSRREYLGMGPNDGVPEMNEALVELWNRQVGEEDVVYLLGDVAMGKLPENLEYVRRLNGIKFLVPGNHDRVHPLHFKNEDKAAMWAKAYKDVGLIDIGIGPHEMTFGGVHCIVSHFPATGDHSTDERYPQWRPPATDLPLVHGHIHSMWRTNGNQFNVGIDAWNGKFMVPQDIAAYFRGDL